MPKKKQGQGAKPRPKNKTKEAKTKKPVSKVEALANRKPLPNILKISEAAWLIIWRNRKSFSLIILIYGIAYLILVLGFSGPSSVSSVKKEFSGVFHGHLSTLYSGLSVYTYLVGSTTSSSTASGSAYQVFILIIASLAIIWALRQYYLGTKIRARDSYYQGLYPIAQYVLVLLFIALELVPLIAGLGLYALLIQGGIAVTVIEKTLSLILIIALVGVSLYLVTSSIISLYIVTLPNMTPMKALRSAKGLVKGRRWSVFRKMIFLPVLLIIVAGLIMIPFILILPAIAAWVFFIITLVGLVYIHSYLYNLYRGLINE